MNLSMRDWLSYENTGTITIPKGFGLIRGRWIDDEEESNGSGKTALIQAITMAFWGEGRTTKTLPSGDLDIRRPPEGRKFIIDLDYDGLIVNRSRSYGKKTDLKVTHNGQSYADGPLKVQKRLDNILNVDYELFRHTFYVALHESHLFTALTPSEAKHRVSNMLDLARWEQRRKNVSIDMSKIEKEIEQCEYAIKTYGNLSEDPEELKLNISELEFEADEIMNRCTECQNAIDACESMVAVNNQELSSLKVKEITLRDIYDDVKKQKYNADKAAYDLECSKQAIESKREHIESTRSTIDTLNNRIIETHEQIGNKVDKNIVKEGLDRLKKLLDDTVRQISDLRSDIAVHSSNIPRYEKIIDRLRQGMIVCPIIEHDCPVLNDDKNRLSQLNYNLNRLQKHTDAIAASKIRIGVLEEESLSLSSGIEKIQEKLSLFDELASLELSKEATESKIKILEDSIEEIKLRTQLDQDRYDALVYGVNILLLKQVDLEKEIKLDNVAMIKIKDKQQKLIDQSNVLRADLVRYRSELGKCQSELGSAKERFKQHEENQARIMEFQNKYMTLSEQMKIINVVHNSFHVNGIPTYIINTITDQIESIANSILESVGHRSRIFIRTKKELKVKDRETGKNKIEDDFKIGITDFQTGSEYTVESDSGGEGFWVDFAIRVALGLCTRERNNTFLNMFMIDEGMGVLAPPAQRRFLNMIKTICDQYKIDYMWLITHTPVNYASDYADVIITAWRDNEKSWIEVK